MQNDLDDTAVRSDQEFEKLFDFAATIIESWRLILFSSLAVVIVILLISFQFQKSYTSASLLRLSKNDLNILESSRVYGKEADRAVAEGKATSREEIVLRIDDSNEDGVYRVSLTMHSAEDAKLVLQNMVDALITETKPDEYRRQRIEARLKILNDEAAALRQSLERMNKFFDEMNNDEQSTPATSSNGSPREGFTTLIAAISANSQARLEAEDELAGSFLSSDIIEKPNIENSKQGRPLSSYIILAVFFTIFATSIFSLLRRLVITNSKSDGIRRIRNALHISQ